jgi:hemolysin activation/secretion protein
MKKNLAITLSLLTSLFATASYATDVPASAESGRLTDRFSGDRLKSQVTNEVLIQDENQPAVAGAELVKFKLNSIRIEGNKVFSAGELQALYANKLGTEVSLAELYAIRDEITKKYREAGYIISRAVIPAQNFDKKGADVVIKIIEGFVNNVSVQGNTRGNRSIINSMVAKIKQKGALNSADLERYLFL